MNPFNIAHQVIALTSTIFYAILFAPWLLLAYVADRIAVAQISHPTFTYQAISLTFALAVTLIIWILAISKIPTLVWCARFVQRFHQEIPLVYAIGYKAWAQLVQNNNARVEVWMEPLADGSRMVHVGHDESKAA